VLVPESGDAIQAMKAGLMEIADLFVVNKADRPGAQRLARDIEMMLHLRAGNVRPRAGRKWGAGHHGPAALAAPEAPAEDAAQETGWEIPVLQSVASVGQGVEEVGAALVRHREWLERSGALEAKRRRRLEQRVRETVMRALAQETWRERGGDEVLEESLDALVAGETTPYRVAARIVSAALG
jgi:LAO/AO transport system kinase